LPSTIENRALRLLGSARKVLVLQGPVGPFFGDLCKELQSAGKSVYRVYFNGGDLLSRGGVPGRLFIGALDQWAEACQDLLDEFQPDVIVLFGQDRPYHSIAVRLGDRRKIRCLVFEEGYVRPFHVTFEPDGVNSRSSLLLTGRPDLSRPVAEPPRFVVSFARTALQAVAYTACTALFRLVNPMYQHHRSLNLLIDGAMWLRAGLRKIGLAREDAKRLEMIRRDFGGRYFLVPLQVHNDAQMTRHSPYCSVGEFIRDAMRSFARHAPRDCALVFKHHPLDRGHRNYTKLISRLAHENGVDSRVYYIDDVHLPTALSGALGTVVVNSTVGFSSLYHRTPVKVMGRALFDVPGLTFQGTLGDFWKNPGSVNTKRYDQFRTHLVNRTQLAGSFYGRGEGYACLLQTIRDGLKRAAAEANGTQSQPNFGDSGIFIAGPKLDA